jgi:hypothetical protein
LNLVKDPVRTRALGEADRFVQAPPREWVFSRAFVSLGRRTAALT